MEDSQKALNFEFPEDKKEIKKVFISYANSFHSKAIVRKLLDLNSDENAKIEYQICGTMQENLKLSKNVEILSSKRSDFALLVAQCDVIICDISLNKNQVEETKIILKLLEDQVGVEFQKTLILISTIMTWAKTPKNAEEILTDRNYRKRRPHPCFNHHLLLERKVLNLSKKCQNLLSFVVCPGIIYGGEEDIFHYIFKKCYFNHPQVEIFMPATNLLPLVHLDDFTRIITQIIAKSSNGIANYFLAVQPDTLTVKQIATIFAEAMGGSDMRVRICEKEEIFFMNEDVMTQRIYDHLTLNLELESEMLTDFEFQMNGKILEGNADKIAEEFHKSRNLRPIKILIDGSPYAYHNDFAKLLSDFYHIHHIKKKCFLKNFNIRLKKKIDGALDYQAKMGDISMKLNESVECPLMMLKAQNDINDWKEQIKVIEQIIAESDECTFEEKKDFLLQRLSSFACSRNQGYVMSGFELDQKKAAELFIGDEEEELNELTKPDFVIIINRILEVDPDCLEIEKEVIGGEEESFDEEKCKQWRLKEYYETQYEDNSLFNFFADRDLIPIEISIDRDLSQADIQNIFEKLKAKIGEACTYELSKFEKDEIRKLKEQIKEMEKAEKEEEERKRIELERIEKEKEIEEWTKLQIIKKQEELKEMEQRSLPIRHYLMKYVLPNIAESLTELAKIRPQNPVKFLAYHLIQQQKKAEKDDVELDEDIIKEFQRLVNESKCDD